MRNRDALSAHVEHFRWRVLQDAIAEASAEHWDGRAKVFAAVGNPRCDAASLACRRHAWLLRDTGLDATARAAIARALAEAEVA